MSDTEKQLQRAFKLIKRDKIDEALDVLQPILADEPDNAHAWWLYAYAATEPRDVRSSLVKVLRLDPNYPNAPKAREMLEKLNQEYPPDSAELAEFPELHDFMGADSFGTEADTYGADLFASTSPFSEADTLHEPFSDDVFGDVFGEGDFEPPSDSLFTTEEDPFADLDRMPFAEAGGESSFAEAPTFSSLDEVSPDLSKSFPALGEEPVRLDESALAMREEREGKRRGRGRRVIFALAVLAVIIAAGLFLYFGVIAEETESTEPGALVAVAPEGADPTLVDAGLQPARTDLLGNFANQAEIILAESDLGSTAYVKLCSDPEPELPTLAQVAMGFIARRAGSLRQALGDAGVMLDAVGVSIETCSSAESQAADTLMRLVIPVDAAASSLPSGADPNQWAAFQAQWQKP